jgi:hypothetical protein
MTMKLSHVPPRNTWSGTMKLPPRHVWNGWLPEISDWAVSANGIKNGILKPVYHVVDWMKLSGAQISPELMHVRNATKEAKNLMAVGELPGKVNNILNSAFKAYNSADVDTIGGLFFSAVDTVSPICDITEWYHARVASFAPATITAVSQINAVALLIVMLKATYTNFCKLGEGINKIYTEWPDAPTSELEKNALEAEKAETLKEGYTIVLRASIDLIKTISYVALAAIALISAFVVTIASAGTYILICSTSATTFTIVGEFTRRALALPSDSK